jgi:hypothetical protein
MLRNRARSQEIRKMYDDMPQQIAALEAEGLFDQADELRDNYIDTRKTEVDLLNNLRKGVNANNYKEFRQDMIASGAVSPEMLPTEYSEKWWRDQVEDKKKALTKFTVDSYRNGAIMTRDYVQQDGTINWDLTGEWYEDPKKQPGYKATGDGKAWEYKPADSNAIGKQVERVFGGFWDPVTGQIKGLDRTQAARVQAVHEEAGRIFSQNRRSGNMGYTHEEAVAAASRRLGVNVPDAQNPGGSNPAGLVDAQGNPL